MTIRINQVSGPRNISTAMMYSFRSRADTTVVDEPLYGHFLRVKPEVEHPGRDETMASMETDGELAIRNTILGDYDTPIVMFKNMSHHMVDVELSTDWWDEVTHLFLIREPKEMLTSLLKEFPTATVAETGLPQQVEILESVVAAGRRPIVADSKDILNDPEGMLWQICEHIGIPWDPAMLSWESGPKPEDGTWSKFWYKRLHRTTGFEPYRPKNEPVPESHQPMLDELESYYKQLSTYRLSVAST